MKNITCNRGTSGLEEGPTDTFTIKASALGLPGGSIPPNSMATDLGNGQSLLYTGTDIEGEWVYHQIGSALRVRVSNDVVW